MSKIVKIVAYENLHHDGKPTVAAKLVLDTGIQVETSVATNDYLYNYQNRTLLDNDPDRYQGQGVLRAVHYINNLIAPKLVGVSPDKQNEIDGWLIAADGTADKSKLGVNTIYAISSLFIKAGAKESGMPLYKYINKLYNTRHTDTSIKIEKLSSPIIPIISKKHHPGLFDFKEFDIAPTSSFAFSKAVEIAISIYAGLIRNFQTSTVTGNMDVMDLIMKTVESLNLRLASDVFMALDLGSASFENNGAYSIKDKPQPLKRKDYMDFISVFTKKYYPLFLVDPIAPNDPSSWKTLASNITNDAYIVGGDLIGSSTERLKKMLDDKVCNAFLIKPSEVGTITEIFELVNLSRKNNLNYIFSNSTFETTDSALSDLSVGVASDFVKLGIPTMGENFAKYNRMMEIESELMIAKPQTNTP